MSGITYDPETILKLDSSYAKICFADKDFSLSDRVGQRFDAWYGGRDWLKAQNPAVGTAFYRRCSGGINVFYLIIKTHNYSKATSDNIDATLANMISQLAGYAITKVVFSGIVPTEITTDILQTKLAALVTSAELSIM